MDPEDDDRYSLVDGNLIISNASETADYGKYQCRATNGLGTAVSRDALLQFACEYGLLRLASLCYGVPTLTRLPSHKNGGRCVSRCLQHTTQIIRLKGKTEPALMNF